MRRAADWSIGMALVTALAWAGSALAADAADHINVAPEGYRGHKLVEIDIQSKAQLDAMEGIGVCMACRVGPGKQMFVIAPDRMKALQDTGANFVVRDNDVQTRIDAEAQAMQSRRTLEEVQARAGVDTFFDDYRTYTEINARLDELIALNPSICTGFVAGTSLEGRPIRGVRIANLNPADPVADEASKPGFAIQGCQHAREWVSPASTTYLADTLVRDYGTDPVVANLVDNVVFYIVPIVNPDGYVYTFPAAQGGQNQRLWRKNRRPNGGSSFGVDLNRNWSVDWGNTLGSSPISTTETYHGTAPFSEPETLGLSNYMSTLPNIVAHLDIHSYSQLILGPWAWSDTVCPPRESELRAVEDAMEVAMDSTHGVNYTAGLGCDALLYIASGVAPDWTFGVLDALAWTYELRDTGTFGFQLPPSQIIPNAEEMFQGVRVLAEFIQLQLDIAPTGQPSIMPSDATFPFGVAITPFNGASYLPNSAMLNWRVGPTGPFTTEPLVGADPLALTATLPSVPCNSELQFYLSANTTAGATIFEPADGPAAPTIAQVVEFNFSTNDTAEVNTGWTVGAPGDTAATGIWNRMDPFGNAAQPEDDHTLAGTMCWITDGNAGASVGSFDVDGGATTLLSPIYDLSASPEAQISYWRWYSNDAGSAPNADIFQIDISNDGGATWVNVETIGPAGVGTGGGWNQHVFDVTTLLATTSLVQLRFIADDAGAGSIIEAAIDDIEIVVFGACAAACPGNTDGSAAVDLADLSNVLFNFGATVPAGTGSDVAGNDGIVDLNDLSLVLFNFGNPC